MRATTLVRVIGIAGKACYLSLVILISFSVCWAQPRHTRLQTVRRGYVGSDGRVHVVTANGKEVTVSKEKGQESVEQPIIADDRRTVGWLVNFPNCCTSYPIPMTLVLYRDGHIIQRLEDGMVIFRWQFLNGGKRVAYFSDTVHGNLGPQCKLVEVSTGKTVQEWSRGAGPLPSWAEVFAEDVCHTDVSTQ